MLRNVYPYCNCKTQPKNKPCFQYQLGRCLSTCAILKNKKVSQQNIKAIYNILGGKRKVILNKLEVQMKNAARRQDFQKAQINKEKMDRLGKLFEHRFTFERFKSIKRDVVHWGTIQGKLQKLLKTKQSILRIEGYDISNISGKFAVGSMVVFEKGVPTRDQYRKFKIKYSGDTPNDPKMMSEVLMRRMKHREWQSPDLILVDGGKTQLTAARKVIPEKQLVLSLAKQNEEIYLPTKVNAIKAETLGIEFLLLMQHIRNEAHRFAIGYHRKMRSDAYSKFMVN